MKTPNVASVSFVIPVRNDAFHLRRCLETIAANRPAGVAIECVVADNGSVDDSAQVARALGANVLSLPNLHVGALRNRAAASASGEVIAFVDADHEIGDGWVAAAVDLFADGAIGAGGARCLPPQPGTWVQQMYGWLRGKCVSQRDVEWLGSGNLAIRKSLFVSVGGFDETLQTCEDVDLCQRIRHAGWRIVEDPRFENVHLGDPRTLRDVFVSERWRGRDNLRVSLRGPIQLAEVPSVVLPVVSAVALFAGFAALLLAPVLGAKAVWIGVFSLALVPFLSLLRTVRMSMRAGLWQPAFFVRAFLVAFAYDTGRAFSLVWPAAHRRSHIEQPAEGQ